MPVLVRVKLPEMLPWITRSVNNPVTFHVPLAPSAMSALEPMVWVVMKTLEAVISPDESVSVCCADESSMV